MWAPEEWVCRWPGWQHWLQRWCGVLKGPSGPFSCRMVRRRLGGYCGSSHSPLGQKSILIPKQSWKQVIKSRFCPWGTSNKCSVPFRRMPQLDWTFHQRGVSRTLTGLHISVNRCSVKNSDPAYNAYPSLVSVGSSGTCWGLLTHITERHQSGCHTFCKVLHTPLHIYTQLFKSNSRAQVCTYTTEQKLTRLLDTRIPWSW